MLIFGYLKLIMSFKVIICIKIKIIGRGIAYFNVSKLKIIKELRNKDYNFDLIKN